MGSASLQPGFSLSGRRFWVLAALLFLFSFGLRLETLQSVYHPDDSPETSLAGATASIQHPPSYPLHSLLNLAASGVLPGNPGFQSAVLAAALASLALVLLVQLGLLIASSLPSGLKLSNLPIRLLTLAFVAGALTQPQAWFQGLS